MKPALLFVLLILLTSGCATNNSDMDPDEWLIRALTKGKEPPYQETSASWTIVCPSKEKAENLRRALVKQKYQLKPIKYNEYSKLWDVETEDMSMELELRLLKKHRAIIESESNKCSCGEVFSGGSILEQPNKALKDAP